MPRSLDCCAVNDKQILITGATNGIGLAAAEALAALGASLAIVGRSKTALLAIINNILDLASIDAGAMTLNLGSVDIRKAMEAAAEGVQDRLVKRGITLEIQALPEIGTFVADELRVRQSLFNLLANAVGFSPAGEIVTFAAHRRREAIAFSVTDRGPGIPADLQDKVFRLVRDAFARLAPPRHGPRHVPGCAPSSSCTAEHIGDGWWTMPGSGDERGSARPPQKMDSFQNIPDLKRVGEAALVESRQ
jgi:NAD(P)-dependent dehydrogenase (short-subunit alcohol dehydrogenase family)